MRADPPELWADVQRRAAGVPLERRRAWVHPTRTAAILVAALVVVGAALYGLRDLRSDTDVSSIRPGDIVRYRLDGPPQPIAVGEGAAWVHIGAGEGTATGLVRIDSGTGEQRPIDTPGGEWPAVGGGSAWLLCNARSCDGRSVLQIDPATGEVVRIVALPGRGTQITGTSSGVWVTTESGVSFVDADGVVAQSFQGTTFDLVGANETSLWVSEHGGVTALDPVDGHEIAHVPFADVCTMEVAGGTVWIASCDGGYHEGNDGDELMGIDARTGDILFRETIEGYGQMRFAGGVLWLAQNDPTDDTRIRILRFDPRTGAPLGNPIEITKDPALSGGFLPGIGIGGPHVFFAVGEGSLWLTDLSSFEVIRIGLPAGSPSPNGTVDAETDWFRAAYPAGWGLVVSGPRVGEGSLAAQFTNFDAEGPLCVGGGSPLPKDGVLLRMTIGSELPWEGNLIIPAFDPQLASVPSLGTFVDHCQASVRLFGMFFGPDGQLMTAHALIGSQTSSLDVDAMKSIVNSLAPTGHAPIVVPGVETVFARGTDSNVGRWLMSLRHETSGGTSLWFRTETAGWGIYVDESSDAIDSSIGIVDADQLVVMGVAPQDAASVTVRLDDGRELMGSLVPFPEGELPGSVAYWVEPFEGQLTGEGQVLSPGAVLVIRNAEGNEMERRRLP
jgi:hypothetical protein